MQPTRWFFINLVASFAFFGALYLGAAFLQIGVPTPSSNWNQQILQRKLARVAQMHGPKLIVSGGSGVIFGIKARMLEEQLGIPAVNLGLHAGLGPDYILQQARQSARPGDTVLVVAEYELYERNKDNLTQWADMNYADYFLAREPQDFRALPLADKTHLILTLPFGRVWQGLKIKLTGRTPPPEIDPVYNSDLLDSWGDLTGLTVAKRPVPPPPLSKVQPLIKGLTPGTNGFKAIGSFCAWAATNHIRVLAAYPNTSFKPEYELPRAKAAFETIRQFYAGQNVPVLGTAEDAILPPDDFFNTCYHPTDEGSVRRTERLITWLRPYFEVRK